MDNIVQLIGFLAWPTTVLIIFAFLRKPISRIADHIGSFFKRGKSLSVNVGSTSFAVETEKSEELIAAMLELVQGMTLNEQKLFRIILDQPPKGLELTSAFERNSEFHETLRSLRDRNLVQPAERGSWRTGKHAMVTRIGHAILRIDRIRDEMLKEGKPTFWNSGVESNQFRESSVYKMIEEPPK